MVQFNAATGVTTFKRHKLAFIDAQYLEAPLSNVSADHHPPAWRWYRFVNTPGVALLERAADGHVKLYLRGQLYGLHSLSYVLYAGKGPSP